MDWELTRENFTKLEQIVRNAPNARKAWADFLALARQCINSDLLRSIEDLDILDATRDVAQQLDAIIEEAPLPSEIGFAYFGLFDATYPGEDHLSQGYYISGGAAWDPDDPGSKCDQRYFPENAYIRSAFLDEIKSLYMDERQGGRMDYETYHCFDYFVVLGASALLTKFATAKLGKTLKIVVGFDEGDVLELN